MKMRRATLAATQMSTGQQLFTFSLTFKLVDLHITRDQLVMTTIWDSLLNQILAHRMSSTLVTSRACFLTLLTEYATLFSALNMLVLWIICVADSWALVTTVQSNTTR